MGRSQVKVKGRCTDHAVIWTKNEGRKVRQDLASHLPSGDGATYLSLKSELIKGSGSRHAE